MMAPEKLPYSESNEFVKGRNSWNPAPGPPSDLQGSLEGMPEFLEYRLEPCQGIFLAGIIISLLKCPLREPFLALRRRLIARQTFSSGKGPIFLY
jgi:hypothetical protein